MSKTGLCFWIDGTYTPINRNVNVVRPDTGDIVARVTRPDPAQGIYRSKAVRSAGRYQADVNPTYVVDGDTVTIEHDVAWLPADQVRAAKIEEIRRHRKAALQREITAGGVTARLTEKTMSRLAAVAAYLDRQPSVRSIPWMLDGGTEAVDLGRDDAYLLANCVDAHVQAVYDANKRHLDALKRLPDDPSLLAWYDATTGWP